MDPERDLLIEFNLIDVNDDDDNSFYRVDFDRNLETTVTIQIFE